MSFFLLASHADDRKKRAEKLASIPTLLLQAVVLPGDRTSEGQLIEDVTLPWFRIVEIIEKEPDAIEEIGWREWEEIVAGAYREEGYDVTLTPRSGDHGRDIIATSRGAGSIKILDQVKAYKPGHVVTASEVREMLGTLTAEPDASKGIVTTTSEFAPGVETDTGIAPFLPHRLELKPREALIKWLASIAEQRG